MAEVAQAIATSRLPLKASVPGRTRRTSSCTISRCAKQDLINRLSIRKGERVENPEFGTIIYDALFEPFTPALKDAIVEDITANLNADPRISTEEILVTEADKGIAIQATITYVPLNITEKLRFDFDENSLLRLS